MRCPVRPLLWPALLAGLLLASLACGDGDGERAASIIHRLLQAAGAEGAGQLESFPGRLPDGLPARPPQYPGAEVIVSSRQPAPVGDLDEPAPSGEVRQPVVYLIVLDTADDREPVFAFYEQALEKDPWQLESTFSTQELDTLQFSNVEDPDISGVVSIAKGGDDGRTSILISLQDAGAFREEAPPFELGESLRLPKEFPPDLPVYQGATITGSAFVRQPGNESFLLIFLTTDSQDDVIEFYREAFQQRGWRVLAGAALGLEERIDFRDDRGDIQGDVLADRFSRDRRYTQVRLQVRVDPAREPVEETPEAAETPEE